MNLSRKNLASIRSGGTDTPDDDLFEMPEKILQFGTGVLLRALPDYFVDKANRQGIFNGRIIVVKSTQTGDTEAFNQQDGLYSISIRGLEEGRTVDQHIICSAISRVLSASHQWEELLACAANPDMQIVISNTTEVGIQLVKESVFQKPPASFPGKLLAFLFERYKFFNGSSDAGMVIIPTELLTDNGKRLKSILLDLASFNNMDVAFTSWLENHNRFCSSLVDRIVPGKPDTLTKQQLEKDWGYTDELMSVCEVYRLWAIEGDDSIRKILSFCSADEGVVITPDITKYKELKLRMLNATHTLSCGLAYLAGFQTVRAAMEDTLFESYIRNLMMNEIAVAIPYRMDALEINAFGLKVLDRFRNPYLQHHWLSITMQYSSKLSMRVVPVLIKYYEIYKKPPELISIGFAAFLLFMRPVKKDLTKYYGIQNNEHYLINDERAPYFFSLWQKVSVDDLVHTLLANEELWQTDLRKLDGFANAVTKHLKAMIRSGPLTGISGLK